MLVKCLAESNKRDQCQLPLKGQFFKTACVCGGEGGWGEGVYLLSTNIIAGLNHNRISAGPLDPVLLPQK